MSPSGERSHGMSSALTTFGSVSYILRNSCDAAMSSMRRLKVLLPTWAKSRSSRILLTRLLRIDFGNSTSSLIYPSGSFRGELSREPASKDSLHQFLDYHRCSVPPRLWI